MQLLAVLFVLASDVMFLVQVFSLLGVPGTELWIEGTREGDALRGCPLQCYSPFVKKAYKRKTTVFVLTIPQN